MCAFEKAKILPRATRMGKGESAPKMILIYRNTDKYLHTRRWESCQLNPGLMLTLFFFGSKNGIPLKKAQGCIDSWSLFEVQVGHPVRLKWIMRKTTVFHVMPWTSSGLRPRKMKRWSKAGWKMPWLRRWMMVIPCQAIKIIKNRKRKCWVGIISIL